MVRASIKNPQNQEIYNEDKDEDRHQVIATHPGEYAFCFRSPTEKQVNFDIRLELLDRVVCHAHFD